MGALKSLGSLPDALAQEAKRLACQTKAIEEHLEELLVNADVGGAAIQQFQSLDEMFQVLLQIEKIMIAWDTLAPIPSEIEFMIKREIDLESLRDRLDRRPKPPQHESALDLFG